MRFTSQKRAVHTTLGYEPGVHSVRGILVFAAALVVTLVVVDTSVWGLLKTLRADTPKVLTPVPATLSEFTSLGNWTDPAADLARTRQAEDERLNRFGWIDRRHGVVRIPIAHAMDLIARRDGQAETPDRATSGPSP